MKFLSLFSGIGAPEKALNNLGIPFELVGYCEIDKYASKSYAAIHGVSETMNLGDITKVDEKALPKDIDLCCYGFPCQDISLAGKQKGLFNEDGTQTRSGLFFEALRIIEATQPRVAIAENVKNLVGKKFNAQFQIVLASLEAAGYNNYWQVLNAKDFGIPQNRERVFIVSIRKDIDNGEFKFPEGFPLELRLKDMLESEVDEKFYLSNDKIQKIANSNFGQEKAMIQHGDVCGALLARDYKDPKCVPVPKLDVAFNLYDMGIKGFNRDTGDVLNPDGICKTIQTMQGGNRQPKIVVQKVGNIYPSGGQNGNVYSADGISPTILSGETNTKGNGGIGSSNAPKIAVRGCAIRNREDGANLEMRKDEVSSALHGNIEKSMVAIIDDTQGFDGVRYYEDYSPALRANRSGLKTVDDTLRIRKLTPKECFRLMGFDDADFEKAEAVNSNTQLYKQAGNSIVVDVLEHLLIEVFRAIEGNERNA